MSIQLHGTAAPCQFVRPCWTRPGQLELHTIHSIYDRKLSLRHAANTTRYGLTGLPRSHSDWPALWQSQQGTTTQSRRLLATAGPDPSPPTANRHSPPPSARPPPVFGRLRRRRPSNWTRRPSPPRPWSLAVFMCECSWPRGAHHPATEDSGTSGLIQLHHGRSFWKR